MPNKKALDTIWAALKSGKTFGYYYEPSNPVIIGQLLWECLSMGQGSDGKTYLFWSHAGSSANKATKADLHWIITVIFKMSEVEFLDKYACID